MQQPVRHAKISDIEVLLTPLSPQKHYIYPQYQYKSLPEKTMRRERWGDDAAKNHRATPGPAAYDIDRGIKGVKWRLDENEADFELK